MWHKAAASGSPGLLSPPSDAYGLTSWLWRKDRREREREREREIEKGWIIIIITIIIIHFIYRRLSNHLRSPYKKKHFTKLKTI